MNLFNFVNFVICDNIPFSIDSIIKKNKMLEYLWWWSLLVNLIRLCYFLKSWVWISFSLYSFSSWNLSSQRFFDYNFLASTISSSGGSFLLSKIKGSLSNINKPVFPRWRELLCKIFAMVLLLYFSLSIIYNINCL